MIWFSYSVKPRIDKESFQATMTLKRGNELVIEVKFIGEPPPKAVWTRADKVF